MGISISKKERLKELIGLNQKLFKCPICNEDMIIINSGSFSCSLSHNFDLAKKGYINLLTAKFSSFYSKELFESRSKICSLGFYQPLIDELVKIISEYKSKTNSEKLILLDAGCGEGSLLYDVYRGLKYNVNNTFIGVDISKESINIATRNTTDIIWCVSDLANLPFKNHSFDIVINILSPANYGEFIRVLNDKGIVVKVVPGLNYLKEIRNIINVNYGLNEYSNTKVINYFKEKLSIKMTKNINYKFNLSKEFIPDLIKMTPLTWTIKSNIFNEFNLHDLTTITVDLILIVGRKKQI